MAIVLRSESVWSDGAGETEMMEVGRSENVRKSPKNLLVRPSFVDASVAYHQVSKGRARGKKKTLWLRLVMQKYLFQLGNFVQVHCGKIVFVGLVALLMSCLGLKTYQMESDIKKLWIDVGARMSREVKYTEDALGLDGGELNEAIIQIPEDEGRNVLTVESLLLHLDVLKVVTSVTVDISDVTWRFKDICHVISLNYFEHDSFSNILENLGPCLIISPLECFWEGSKIAGPDKPVTIPHYGPADWSNLNPQEVLKKLSSLFPSMVDEVREIIDKAGISTGYQEKPCLNPFDPKCPESAPNFLSKEPPDVASVLSHGCDGFARKYLHWNEDLILGGIQRNKSGDLVRAKALQSIIFVLGEKNLYEMFKGVLIPWNETLAEDVIRIWEKQMTKDVEKFMSGQNNNNNNHHDLRPLTLQQQQRKSKSRDKVLSFTSSNMAELLADCSQVSYVRLVLGLLLVFCYAILANANFKRCSESQATVAMAGLLLLVLSTTAGLGLCSVLHLTFNAITTQVVPFLVIGFGMDHIFLTLNTYTQLSRDGVPYEERTGACLKRVGGLVLTSSVCNSSSFLLASLIPIPATRFFCLQCCLLTLVNGASVLLLFPAMVSIDLMRRRSGKMDFFCCQFRPPPAAASSISYTKSKYRSSSSSSPSSSSSSSSKQNRWVSNNDEDEDDEFEEISIFSFKSKNNKNSPKIPERGSFNRNNQSSSSSSSSSSRSSGISSLASSSHDLLTYPPTSVYLPTSTPSQTPNNKTKQRKDVCSLFADCVLSKFIKRFYGPFLERLPVKIVVIGLFIICIVVGVGGVLRVKEGLEVMDVLPLSSPEREFLRIQSKYFGFYNFYVATQDNFNYASEQGQQLLHTFHHSIRSIKNVVRSKDGKFFEFWLETFQNWLLDVQEALDIDLKRGAIVRDEWFANSTSLGRLGYKLMVQTGIKSSPIDKNRIHTGRLVSNGIIYTPAFYNYLSAWVNNDVFSYDFLQANIKPSPKHWNHDKNDPDFNIPASNPIVFAQSAFVFNNLHSFEAKMNVLSDIRNVCDTFTSRGLPSYPHGFLVTFWEQYFSVRFYLFVLVAVVLAAVFVVVLILLLNPFAAFLEIFVLACTMVELYGFMGLAGIRMSALSAVILVIAIGATVHITVPFVLAFQTCIGSRDRRMILSLEQVVTAILHFFVAAFLGLLVLATTELVFIRRYIFIPFVVMLIIGCFNGLVFLPVLLSLVGPSAEVTPLNDDLYLPPPSPVIRPHVTPRSRSGQKASYKTRKKSRSGRSRSRITTRLKNPPNLSTIVEESSNNSCASSISIDLKPTIIISNPSHCCSTSQPQSSTPSPSIDVVGRGESWSADAGRKVPPPSYYLHSSTGSASMSSPVQVSSCTSSHCIATVEATTKVKVHICDQKDRQSKCRTPQRQKNTPKRDHSSERHHHHKRARH